MILHLKCVLFQTLHYAKQIKCPQLVIKTTGAPYYMSEKAANDLLDVYRENNGDNFVFHKVEGGHHVHLNETDKIAPLVNDFLAR